ncbi:hypothetical protein EC991_000034 [Linnemannia zychae]|nr:hypothetical protein EC991_000034 [Linnemannia zychae]
MLRISTLNKRIGSKALLPLRNTTKTATFTTARQSWLGSLHSPHQQLQRQQPSIFANGFSTSSRSFAAIEKKALSKKITLPKDPYLLSEKVVKFAKNGKLDDAITLVMEAPKSRQNEVVWNHLIQESSKLGKMNQSWQLLNDMKKRGFEPSERTFTILLNSLAINAPSSPNSVSRARALYTQIEEHPDIDPTTVHTNALLKVCARQCDYTALQEVYETMIKQRGGGGSSSGRDGNAPDVITYSTMINAYARKGGDEGFEAAWKVWEDCLEAMTTRRGAEDVELDTRIVDGILLACREARSPVFMRRGYKLIESLYGLPASSSPSPSGSGTGSGAGHVSATERATSPSKHLGLAPAMLRKETIHPRTVELLLSICSKLKDFNRANHYMTLIKTTFPDFKADPKLLSSLMFMQTANKQFDEAIASWDEISRLDLPHTPATFKQGLDAAAKARNWEKTLEMYTLMRTLISKNKTLPPPDHRVSSLVNPVVRTQDAWTLVSTLKCAVKTNHLEKGLDILRESRWTRVVQNPQYPRANVDLANLAVKILGAMLKSNKEALDGNSVTSSTSTNTTSTSSSSSSDSGAAGTGLDADHDSSTSTLTKATDNTAKHTREMERLKRELTDAKAIQTQVTAALANHDAGKTAQKEMDDASRLRNRRIRNAQASTSSLSSSSRRRGFEDKDQNNDEDNESERGGSGGGGWRKVSAEEYSENHSSSRTNNYSRGGSTDNTRQKTWTRRDSSSSTKPRRYQRDGGDNRSSTPADDPFKPTTRFVRTFDD